MAAFVRATAPGRFTTFSSPSAFLAARPMSVRSTCPPFVLTLSHSDPAGVGGVQADLLAMVSLGAHPVSVLTAVTVQDTAGLLEWHPIDPDTVEDQARALLEDVPVAAIKVGTLASVEAVTLVAEILADYPDLPVVAQPSFGLLGDEAEAEAVAEAWQELLLPQTTLHVGNVHDLRRLLEGSDGDPAAAARELLACGCEGLLLVSAAEAGGMAADLLFLAGGETERHLWDASPGTCRGVADTLAAAVAAALAGGDGLREAVLQAHGYTERAVAAAFSPGMGGRLPDRLFWARAEGGDAD